MWTILVLTLKWLNNNVRFVKRLIDGKPTLLIKNGKIDPEACRSVGLSASDVALKLRSQGIFQMKQGQTSCARAKWPTHRGPKWEMKILSIQL